MSFTYAQLQTAIQDFTENTETTFVNNIPLFIKAAEEAIFKNIDLNEFRKNVSANMSNGNKYLPVPSDFLSTISLQFTKTNGDQEFLEIKDVEFVQEFWKDASDTGVPRYYAIYDVDNLLIAPTPDTAYDVEMHYYYRPASLTTVGVDGTTWLSENVPFALLYGSLLHAYIFMKGEPDVIQQYQQQFSVAIQSLAKFGVEKETTDFYRTGQPLRPKA